MRRWLPGGGVEALIDAPNLAARAAEQI